jgi:predicted permease
VTDRLASFAQDVRYAFRALRSSRGYAAWVIGSLAVGMAVTIAALALLNATMVLPFAGVTEQHGLVRVTVSLNCGRPNCWLRMSSPADYAALEDGVTGLQGLAGYAAGEIAVALPEARSMRSLVTTANYFDVLGVRPLLGRLFDTNDASTNAAVAVIAHGAWVREFGGDPSIVGRSIRVADRFVHIIGVAPANFIGIDRIRPGGRAPDVWLPMGLADDVLPLSAAEQRRQERDVAFVGRLRPGFAVPQLRTEAEVLARRLAASRGQETQRVLAEVERVWRVRPESWHFGVIIVMPIPILVLVIACVNAANLMLARGSQRQREIAIRLAIGAGRGRIIRQFLIESAMLATLAAGVAVPLAWWGLQLASNPLGGPVPFDSIVLGLTVLTAAATTLAFGLVPAVRVSAQRPSSALGPTGARDVLPRQSHLRRALVVAQVALSLGLLATAWQLVATVRAQAVSSGTPADRLLMARFDLQPLKLAPGESDRFYRDLGARAALLRGAEAVGLARHSSVWTFGQAAAARSIVVWRSNDAPDDGHLTIGGYAGGDLFEAVGLRVIAGRGFTDADRRGRPQVAIVNQTFAEDMSESPVGSSIRVAPRNHDFISAIDVRIIGIIEAALEPRLNPEGPPAAKVYLPSPIEPEPALTLYVRTRSAAAQIAQPLRELASAVSPRVPILELGSLEDMNERSYETQLWLARGAALLGVIGLLLATAGLYGVSSYVVAMRSRELAIRMAIGARPGVILAMVLGESIRIALIGLVVGAGAAAAASRMIQSEYHGIKGLDGAMFGGAAALFLVAMLLASAVPALRASRLDPVETLKDI